MICKQHEVMVVHHPVSMGNGAAVKSGARAASRDVVVFMDADSQHNPDDIDVLIAKLDEGYDMAVGARTYSSHANHHRAFANLFYNRLASWMTGHKIHDLTSGFRAVKIAKFREFLHLLPNGFSYPTTITMAFFRAGYAVGYVPIAVAKRTGKSHIRLLRDGARFFLIIFRIGVLYSPLKLFLPISLFSFALGALHYAITYIESGRFTNMSALLFITSILIFLLGLVSEQITMLMYQNRKS
jgi:glycosyltransferase involved in cell wall biosynthesis